MIPMIYYFNFRTPQKKLTKKNLLNIPADYIDLNPRGITRLCKLNLNLKDGTFPLL